jgi:transposase
MMMRKYEITKEQAREIKNVLRNYERTSVFRKLQAIMLIGEGESVPMVSRATLYNEAYIYQLIKQFCNEGLSGFANDGRGGARRRNLTNEQETQIMKKFEEKAVKGQVVSLTEVKKEYERVRGKETANSTFYDFLERVNWRRVMPRGAHPKKASDEVIEASKKLTFR